MRKLLFIGVPVMLMSSYVWAQQSFVEGQLTYKVLIVPGDPSTGVKQVSEEGTLVIRVKGNKVVKELQLQSGFTNTMVLDGAKSAHSLRKIGNARYAIQLAPSEIEARRTRCKDMQVIDMPVELKTVASYNTVRAKVVCNDAGTHDVYYTKEWTINNPLLFEQFPNFGYLPLKYSIKNDKGATMTFTLEKAEAIPLDNAQFAVPQGYKVISSDEYRSWNH
jgi:hypothetical protein